MRSAMTCILFAAGICLTLVAIPMTKAPRDRTPIPEVVGTDWNPLGRGIELIHFKEPLAPNLCAQPNAAKGQRRYVGFENCYNCHNRGAPGKIILPGGVVKDLSDEQWVLYTEYPTWRDEDKHSQAYTVLLNERSKKMGRLLGIAEVHRDKRCLVCHTGYPVAQMPLDKNGLIDKKTEKMLDINLGVSCEGCHGPSGDYKGPDKNDLTGWLLAHQVVPKEPYANTKPWRFQTPKEKQAFGFFDVRSPASRTKLCVSCHVGDIEQGRFVSHDMYAAGHPPLPGFELETFTQQMGKHWKHFWEKKEKVQEHFIEYTNDPFYSKKNYKREALHRTRSLLVGALVTASEYARLAEQLADDKVESPVSRPEWGDFSIYDCYSCHHELKHDSWRQIRKPLVKKAGRPGVQEWPFTLARIALKTLAGKGEPTASDDFNAKVQSLREATTGKPLGYPTEVRDAARAVHELLSAKGTEMEKRQVSREEGIAVLKELADLGSTEILDYDSARQFVWAFEVVLSDLKASNFAPAKSLEATIDPYKTKTFLWNLRDGRKAATQLPGEDMARATMEVTLESVLPYISNYNPLEFQKKFAEIRGMLNAK